MIQLDKIKIVTSRDAITITAKDKFEKIIKDGEVLAFTYTKLLPYHLFIKDDFKNNEVVIEFTGKILQDKYPLLICSDTIRECLTKIQHLKLCRIDIESVILTGQVCKIDVTLDTKCDDIPSLTKQLRANIKNFNKHLPRLINGNFVIEKNVKTPAYKKRLTIYDKHKELNMAGNKTFLAYLNDAPSLLDQYQGVARFELNLNSKEQIRKSLCIRDTTVYNVLNSDANPIYDFIVEVLGDESDAVEVTDYKDYVHQLILKDNDNDLAKVQLTLQRFKPSVRVSRMMKPFQDLVQNSENKGVSIRATLKSMLLCLFPIVVLIVAN